MCLIKVRGVSRREVVVRDVISFDDLIIFLIFLYDLLLDGFIYSNVLDRVI